MDQELKDQVIELRCNLDDMTPERLGFAIDTLMDGGALDAFSTPIGMKKSRPGVLLTVLCRPRDREKIVRLIFQHTTTLGVRESLCQRYILGRSTGVMNTSYGQVHTKVSEGWGVRRVKMEYDDLARLARENKVGIREITGEDNLQ